MLPGVRYASLASGLPPRGGLVFGQVEIEGRQMSDVEKPGAFGGGWVAAGYFEAMGIPVREGRTFGDADMKAGATTLVINDTMARRYWPGDGGGRQEGAAQRQRSLDDDRWRGGHRAIGPCR